MNYDPQQAPRPPFVQFEMRKEEDREASVKEGHYVAKDVVFAIITPQGSKDRVPRAYEDWIEQQKAAAAEGRIPSYWLAEWQAAHAAWSKNEEVPVNGHPLKNWPLLSPAQLANLLQLNCRTVEDVAALTEEGITRLGMGARALKLAAVDWLGAFENGKAAQEIASIRSEKEQLALRVDTLTKQVEALLALVPADKLPKAVATPKQSLTPL